MQRAHEGLVGYSGGLIPPEPAGLGALARRRARVPIGRDQEVPQVEVGVALGGVVHVHVDEAWTVVGMGELEAGLLAGLAQRRSRWLLSGLKVAPGLQPPVQALVHVEDRAATPHDHGRTGDVFRPGVLVERARQALEVHHDASPRPGFAAVAGHMGIEGGPDPRRQSRGPATMVDRTPHALRHGAWLPHRTPSHRGDRR